MGRGPDNPATMTNARSPQEQITRNRYVSRIQDFAPRHRTLVVLAAVLVAVAGVLFARMLLDVGRVRITSAHDLQAYFHEIGYTPRILRSGHPEVPRFVVSSVPEDWADELTVSEKKNLFFRALLPMVLMVNEDILDDRARLRAMRKELSEGRSLKARDFAWLRALAESYGFKDDFGEDAMAIATLLRRVDVIPPSLALAQSAVESAYATSRFAVEGNALFGQWRIGKGLVPQQQRKHLGDYRVADFDTPMASIRAYMRNLNTNPAYKTFRDMRASARASGDALRGAPLAAGLRSYSEKGEAYVGLLRRLIAFNQLATCDSAKLLDTPARRIVTGAL